MKQIVAQFGGQVPLMANMVEGGDTPMSTADELESLGFSLVIFPGGLVRAIARTATDYFASLKAHGSNQPFRDRMLDFEGMNALVGAKELLAIGNRYDMDKFKGNGE
jgi:2-methylisocitrate lyase-like PEP mutase family enzyme